MALEIYKRSRATEIEAWSDWATTTDAPPYTNTVLVEYKSTTSVDIEINDITNSTEVNNGTGIFDKLIYAAFLHINAQVDLNRLTQGEAGKVYAAAIQSAMSEAIQFALTKNKAELEADMLIVQKEETLLNGAKERELKDYQLSAVLPANVASTNKQVELYERQRQGFDDNKYQKLFESQLNAWGLMYSSGTLENIPTLVTSNAAASLYNTLKPAGTPDVPLT